MKILYSMFLLGLSASALATTPELYQEYPQPGEDQQFAKFAEEIRDVQKTLAQGDPILRAFHSKAHVCLKGEFQVLSNLPKDAQYGVFTPGAKYPIWGRFSNASGKPKPDSERDMRGLALKLMQVKGGNQDFLMTNGPVHFAKDAAGMMEFAEAGAQGTLAMATYFATHPKAAYILMRDTSHPVRSMTTESYWSRVPFKIGPKAMKYNVVPCSVDSSPDPKNTSPTYLTDDLRARASRAPICFDFRIQFQEDPVAQPIEDASIEWKEEDTSSITVAKVIFPVQEFDSTEQMKFCEDINFSPWHAVPDLRPLGNMNRARRSVYPSSAEFRGSSFREPVGTSP